MKPRTWLNRHLHYRLNIETNQHRFERFIGNRRFTDLPLSFGGWHTPLRFFIVLLNHVIACLCPDWISNLEAKDMNTYFFWVHFRFGRFGDELLFGTQHVLNVHFGSRPKWTCKVQTQGLCFCDTRCVLVFQVSPEFGGSLPLIRCHLIMAAAVAEQEALKVQTWLMENGIESTADFAFWFTNYEEALQEAGRAVANAWEIARKTSEPGIAGLVRRIFEAEKAGQVEAAPVPSQSLRIRPTRAKRPLSAPVPGRRSGYEKEVQPSMAMHIKQSYVSMDGLGYAFQLRLMWWNNDFLPYPWYHISVALRKLSHWMTCAGVDGEVALPWPKVSTGTFETIHVGNEESFKW